MLTDDQIRAAYLKTGANYTMTEHHMRQAKLFIGFIFDVLEPATYDEEMEPLYRRPE